MTMTKDFTMLRMTDVDLAKKKVLIREDLNVPIQDGRITSSQRLEAALPTIRAARDAGAAVMVMSHLGRPKEGMWDAASSLQPVADWLSHALSATVPLVKDYLQGAKPEPGQVVLLENCRMNRGEESNAPELARQYATLCDVFVMDAFATAHRAQASTEGVARQAAVACAGPLLCAELDALAKALKNPAKPMLAVVGGAKVSTKLDLLGNLLAKVDRLIVGGGIANTFLAAAGFPIGASLHETELLPKAREIMTAAENRGAKIPLPVDVVVAKEFAATAKATVKEVAAVESNDLILDIGPRTAHEYADLAGRMATIVWNGPVGVFEFDQFGEGTKRLAQAIAKSSAFSIAGGGDTLAAIDKYGLADDISYISTGGGAFLEYLEGRALPAVVALEERVSQRG